MKAIQWSDMKYLMVLTIPLAVFSSLYFDGIMSYFIPFMNFVGIPILDILFPKISKNEEEVIYEAKKIHPFFDWLLYMNVPLQFSLLFYALYILSFSGLPLWMLLGKAFSMGICCAVLGINTAHELGHRKLGYERFLAKLLLMTAGYMHFTLVHNRGHHNLVATPLDPASARKNETVYQFLVRSIFKGYAMGWSLENERLHKEGHRIFSLKNEMLTNIIVQLFFESIILFFFGWQGLLWHVLMIAIGIIVLESINYVEHYGLERKQDSEGKYERVKPWHSWNSDHILGRIMLLELTRHSDHHYKASRKYQTLRTISNSPQLIFGYPGSMVLSWLPPLWFKLMNKQLQNWEQRAHLETDYLIEQ